MSGVMGVGEPISPRAMASSWRRHRQLHVRLHGAGDDGQQVALTEPKRHMAGRTRPQHRPAHQLEVEHAATPETGDRGSLEGGEGLVVEQLRAVDDEDERITEPTTVGGDEHSPRDGQADLGVGSEGVRRDLIAGQGGPESQPGPHEDRRGIEPRQLHAPGKGGRGPGVGASASSASSSGRPPPPLHAPRRPTSRTAAVAVRTRRRSGLRRFGAWSSAGTADATLPAGPRGLAHPSDRLRCRHAGTPGAAAVRPAGGHRRW